MPSAARVLAVAALALVTLSGSTDALAKRACDDAKFADQYATIKAKISACEATSGVAMVSPLSVKKKQTLCDKCPDLGVAAESNNWPVCYVVAAGEQLNIRTLFRRWFKPCVSTDSSGDSGSSTGGAADPVATVAPSDDSAETPAASKTPKPSTTPKASSTPKPTKTPKASKENKASKSSDGSDSAADSTTKTPKPSKTPKPKTPKPKSANSNSNSTDSDASLSDDDAESGTLAANSASGSAQLDDKNASDPLSGSKSQSKASTGSSISSGAIAGIVAGVVALVMQC